MAGVFKPITAKSITQHTAHKEYDLTFAYASKTASFDGVSAYHHSATSRNLVNGRLQDYPATDAANSNGTSFIDANDEETLLLDQDVYNAIRGRYIIPEFIPNHRGMRYSNPVSMSVFSLPKEYYWDGIKPGTVEVSLNGGATTFTDDGLGNLYEGTALESSSALIFQLNVPYLENTQHGNIPFNWRYNVDGADTSLCEANGYNLSFRSGRHEGGFTTQYHAGSSVDIETAVEFSQSNTTSQLWKKGVKPTPTDSVVWLDRLPRTAFYHTDNFQGISIAFRARRQNDLTPDSSGEQTLFQLGPKFGDRTPVMKLMFSSPNGFKLKLKDSVDIGIAATGYFADGDTITGVVTVTPDGVVNLRTNREESDAISTTTDTLTDSELRELKVYSPLYRHACIGAAFELQDLNPQTYGDLGQPVPPKSEIKDVQFSERFGGQVMDFRIYNRCLPSADVLRYVTDYYDMIAGNVYYDDGLIVLTGTSGSHRWTSGNATVGFKNTVKREEYEYTCQIQETELNMSQNPSILVSGSTADNPVIASFVSSSGWDPYITTIGLYNEQHELMAVGKLGRPIRKVEDYDLSFIVRFDV